MIFALSENNIIVHISNVTSGLSCKCTCLNCGVDLVARKGNVNMHHFSHYNSDECAGALETSLHKFAKSVILESQTIHLPALKSYLEFNCDSKHYNGTFQILSPRSVSFDSIVSEASYSNIVPDIIAYSKQIPLFIEIAVTHFIDEDKISKIKSIGVSTIEIDLSDVYNNIYDYSEAEIKTYILDVINKDWIFNRNEDKLKKDFIDKKVSDIQKENEKRLKTLSVKLDSAIYQHSHLKSFVWDKPTFQNDHLWKRFSGFLGSDPDNCPEYLNFEIKGDAIIEVDRRLWQTILFSCFIYKYISKQANKNKRAVFSVELATHFLKDKFKIPFNRTLEYSSFVLKETEDYPSLAGKREQLSSLRSENSENISHIIYQFFNNLHNYGFVSTSDERSDHYFYTYYQVLHDNLII